MYTGLFRQSIICAAWMFAVWVGLVYFIRSVDPSWLMLASIFIVWVGYNLFWKGEL